MKHTRFIIPAVVAASVLFAAAPVAINATVSQSNVNVKPVQITTSFTSSGSAGIVP